MNLYLPGAKWLPVSYRREAGTFAARPLGYVIHVQQGNNSPGAWFNRLTSPDRKFSHAWVAKDGSSEQYAELDCQSWAQGDGNPLWWSFETEGYAHEVMTPEQVNTLARWHNFLGVPDDLANLPTHASGGAAWGGHTCPGVLRAMQRGAVIARAQALRRAVVLTVPPVVFTNPTVPPPVPTAPREEPTVRVLDLRSGITSGPGVKPLQRLLSVKVDGLAGPVTKAALIAAQRRVKVEPDAIFGVASATAMLGER